MSDRASAPPPPSPVSDHQIAEALDSLLRDATAFTSLNGVIHHLETELGVTLAHRIDFIRARIQHYLLHPHHHPQNFTPHHHQPHQFSPVHDTLTFQAPTDGYAFRPQMHSQPQPHLYYPPLPPQLLVKNPTAATPSVPPKESAPPARKRRGGPGGLNKLCGVSPELQTIVGQPTMPRTEIVKQLWAYIRKHNLQDPNNKRKIICNEELRLVLETDCTDMFKMNKLLAKHILPLDPAEQTSHIAKKPKDDVQEPETKREEPIPIVTISEVLANFFGTDEREMSQAEVLRQMWEYIKVNQLEDPSDPTAIVCDAKLQELLGCESISALDLPSILAHRNLYKS